MKALYLLAPGKTEIREVPVPSLNDNEILLKVGMVGFCGSDLNGFRGVFELQEYPIILGHEVGATIEKKGKNVPDEFQSGMRVTVNPYLACGKCVSCRKGRPNACQDNKTMGVRRPGAMTEYIAVPWDTVYPSTKLSLKELALVEPLTVGFHAVKRGRVTGTDKVAVFGCGIVGMGALVGSIHQGAEVIAIDVEDSKMVLAKKAGAKYTINSSRDDLHNTLAEITGGDGPDVVIEAVGNDFTYRAAVEEVAYSGRVVYIGYAKRPVLYNTSLFVKKEIEILGSRNCLGDFPDVINYLETGAFPVEDMITSIVTIDQAGEALAGWAQNPGKVSKIMVQIPS